MARGGIRPNAGRKKGAATSKTQAIAKKAAESGISPLEYMLNVMRSEPPKDADALARVRHTEIRFEAAKAAAPYIHPRLAAVEHSGKDGGDIQVRNKVTVEFVSSIPRSV